MKATRLPGSRLPANTSRCKKLYEILNSAFVLWLLSTVVVGAVTYFWSSSQADKLHVRETTARVNRLRVEIADRAINFSAQAHGFQSRDIPQSRRQLFDAIHDSGILGSRSRLGGGLPELRDRSLTSLLLDLLDDDPGHRQEILRVIGDLQILSAIERGRALFPDEHDAQLFTEHAVRALREDLNAVTLSELQDLTARKFDAIATSAANAAVERQGRVGTQSTTSK